MMVVFFTKYRKNVTSTFELLMFFVLFFLIAIIILKLRCNFTFTFYVFLIYMRHALETMYAFKKVMNTKDPRRNFLIKLVWFKISKIKKNYFLIVKNFALQS